jgi:hypothetical protein
MSRKNVEQIVAAAHGALVEGERVTEFGTCWAARIKPRVPLLFTARRQYLMVLTDRRLLLFKRRRKALRASDLVLGKRYEAFSLGRVRRTFPLASVRAEASNGARMVFEFRPGQRHLSGALAARLSPAPPPPTPDPVTATPDVDPRRADPTDSTDATDSTKPVAAVSPIDAPARSGPVGPSQEETSFWGPPARGA